MSLPAPHTSAGRRGLAQLLASPGRALLAMDFDGTLAPIGPDPALARADPRVSAVLARIAAYVGRLAVITGRPADTAVKLGNLGDVANLTVLGHYGAQRWQGGRLSSLPVVPGVDVVRRRLPAVLAAAAAPDGTSVEDKGRAISVHVRGTSDPAAALARLRDPVDALAREAGLVLERGRMVLELRPGGMDKGQALRGLVAEAAKVSSLTALVYIGDDLADLAAFAEVEQQRANGLPGLLIFSGSTEVAGLATRADLVVNGPDGVISWLEGLATALADGETSA